MYQETSYVLDSLILVLGGSQIALFQTMGMVLALQISWSIGFQGFMGS